MVGGEMKRGWGQKLSSVLIRMESCEELLKDAVRLGWGDRFRYAGWKSRRSADKSGYQFASHLNRGTLTLELDVVIKKQPQSEDVRKMMFSDLQFHNEVLMYEKLLPLLGSSDIAPEMYSGRATLGAAPEKDIVVLQLLTDYSIHRCDSNYLDFEHLKLCLVKLGQFHARSYEAKTIGRLREAADGLKRVGFSNRDPNDYSPWMTDSLMRGIKPLMSDPVYKETLDKLVESFKCIDRVAVFLESYEEPTAVLCHGDFCSNNLLFKYNKEGRVEDVKFIDFQTSRYASPAVDLSFFLYLNTPKDLLTSMWDDLLELYLRSLFSSVRDHSVLPTRNQMLKEFSTRALYGYFHCSFFLPMMIQHHKNLPYDQFGPPINVGGDEATEAIVAVMKHLVDRGYVNAFLDKYLNG